MFCRKSLSKTSNSFVHGSGNHSSSKGLSMNPNPTYRRENSHGKNNGSASDNSDDESRARLFEDKK